MAILSAADCLAALSQARQRIPVTYKAMFSSWLGGIVTDPALMLVPLDDHLVHRGDGVFEALRFSEGHFFDLRAHLGRLEKSSNAIGLKCGWSEDQWIKTCQETAQASGLQNGMMRIFVGRGPGSFSANPFECPQSQVYIVVTEFKPVPEDFYQNGVRVMVSKVLAKEPPFSQIKSCNYLPNVLMKKESVEHKMDFSVGFTAQGFLAEGPTENMMILASQGVLVVPKFDYTLRGTTLLAVLDSLKNKPLPEVREVVFADLSLADVKAAKEGFMVGTTLEVLPISEFAGQPLGTGRPGPVARELRCRLQEMMKTDQQRRVPIG